MHTIICVLAACVLPVAFFARDSVDNGRFSLVECALSLCVWRTPIETWKVCNKKSCRICLYKKATTIATSSSGQRTNAGCVCE
ncbi:hypothetical protein PF005_g1899 [Phytophthora fragariae]|uniref:Secreted protein n=1 Tax=Phytophthora fragariae TaxID=53985 RepID=A0A6A3ZFD4_9STRA|nr:hypothetical protein PF003_g27223 [Phytophthora fragariae]KAE8948406.1 hypothetical protein PF009_g2023 [Phytophthora fragariae]KAE9027743.1 hypothetical protein PF011_g1922 [Phytophthora fragariae]KAE9090579.1 hypothetical protein PF010_g18535 [Phytophthora fragariae]KAE9136863.1 hypothetical protein PF007_g2016 [Phytophthora fragariae]